jgi:hypothetical protein
MLRLTVLASLLLAATATATASSPSIRVQTTIVTPKVITESPVRRAAPRHARHAAARARTKRAVLHARRVPRPLSPGEFGRARRGL